MAYRRVAVLAGLLLTAAPFFAVPAGAQVGSSLSPHFGASLTEWMSLHQVPAASVAIMKGDRLMSTAGLGGMSATAPARIASLSKAITGVCIAHLVDAGRLSFTATLGTVLAKTFARLGQPADPRFKTITIEQLLMHRAGLAREPLAGPPARNLTDNFIKWPTSPAGREPTATSAI